MTGKVDLKVVLLGKAFAGKTSLVDRYIHDRFLGESVPYQNTIGAAFGAKKIEVNGKSIVLGIWDTAGSERYEAMSRIYYRGAKAAIVCYDLTDKTSFERTSFWITELQDNEKECKIYLCGTKKDLASKASKREIDFHDTQDFADGIGATVFETSSKSGENIKEIFDKIGEDFIKEQRANQRKEGAEMSIRLQGDSSTKRLACCLVK